MRRNDPTFFVRRKITFYVSYFLFLRTMSLEFSQPFEPYDETCSTQCDGACIRNSSTPKPTLSKKEWRLIIWESEQNWNAGEISHNRCLLTMLDWVYCVCSSPSRECMNLQLPIVNQDDRKIQIAAQNSTRKMMKVTEMTDDRCPLVSLQTT